MQGLTMTGSDLSSSSKDWEVQHRISTLVYAEFHEQVQSYTVIHCIEFHTVIHYIELYTVIHSTSRVLQCYTLYTV